MAIKCGQFEIIELFLEHDADPDFMENRADQPIHTAVIAAHEVLIQFSTSTYETNIKAYEIAKKQLFQVLDLLIKYGADCDDWADNQTWGDKTCRTAFFGDFVPKEDKPYEIKYRGKIIKGVTRGNTAKDIREVLQEYVKRK